MASSSSSSSSSAFKKIRQELKDWERSFVRLNGRSPAKDDIKSASPSIYNRYRTYACLKHQMKNKSKEKESVPERNKRDFQDVYDYCNSKPSSIRLSNDGESSDESEGSHISATPPRKKTSICMNEEISSKFTKPQTCARNLNIHASKNNRPALCEINNSPPIIGKVSQEGRSFREGNFFQDRKVIQEGNAFQEGNVDQELKLIQEENVFQEAELRRSSSLTCMDRAGDSDAAASQALLGHQVSKLGFTIKLRRHGEVDKENFEAENIPAGFFLNCASSFRNSSKLHTRTILSKEPGRYDNNTNQVLCMESAGDEILTPNILQSNPSFEQESDTTSDCPKQVSVTAISSSDQSTYESVSEKRKVINIKKQSIQQEASTREQDDDVLNNISVPGGVFTRSSSVVIRTENSNLSSDTCDGASVSSLQTCLEEMTVVSLRKLLSSKGLPISGKKSVLIERAIEESISHIDLGEPRETKRTSTKRQPTEVTKSDEAILEEDNGIDRNRLQKLAKNTSKKCNSTVEFINWNTLQKGPHMKKKLGTRENFVKLNIGKRGNKSHRFVNASSKRFKRYKFKSYKRKAKHNADKKGDEFERCSEDTHVYDMDGNSLEGKSGNDLVNSHRESKHDATGINHIHGSAPDYATEAFQNPTEDNLLKVLKFVFGFKSFRPGQLETIQRILRGESTMLMLPTGSGKSLSYQLPAFLLPGLTLVVSPLIAVMIDQLQHLPSLLPGAFLSSTQTSREYSSILDRLRSGELKVLFVSPERLMCEEFLNLLQSLPCISLAVVDEAHCLSEWSHNFRPSYYRLGIILQQKLHLNCILAMTATASKRTIDTIMDSLSIPHTNKIQTSPVRKNLLCTASRSTTRYKDLLSLFQSSPFKDARSIIVYCNFQMEAENVSLVLQDNGINAKSYHGGMDPAERKRTQELFCSNKLRVVVATVAFGLGLDKSDVNAVIHYGLPNSLEHYMQETGRAGRNGTPAHCHIFVDDSNYLKLRSLAFSENVDVVAIKNLLSKIFIETSLENTSNWIKSIPIESATKDLDLKMEVVATTLSYLEVDKQYVSVLPEHKIMCTLQFHKSSPIQMARNSLLVDAILKKSQEKRGEYNFELPAVANHMGLKLQNLQQQLQQLQVTGEVSFTLKAPALCFHILQVPADLDALAIEISKRFSRMEFLKVKKLDFIFQTASSLTSKEVTSSESYLQETVECYFESEEEYTQCKVPDIVKNISSFLKADIKVFLQNNSSQSFSSRSIARIFHGISSPAYPSSIWSQNHFWGRYINMDFNSIKEAAENILGSLSSKSHVC